MALARASLFLLLGLACVCRADRTLTATNLNCAGLHPKCNDCVIKQIPAPSGASSQKAKVLICTSCVGVAYTPYTNPTSYKSTCACAPGYFLPSGTGSDCLECPKGYFCKGGVGGAATKLGCGDCLTTISTKAQNVSSCVTKPGCAYKADATTRVVTGTSCPIGKFNAGGNKQPCTKCPGGLTTEGFKTDSIDKCKAPDGYYYKNRQALPCPQGTFKVGLDMATACTPCPNGLTTMAQASQVAAACELSATLGYYAATVDGVLTAKPCPRGSYSSNGRSCTACPDGLDTAVEGASNVAGCQAGPGYGYDPALTGTNKKYQCPVGSFKAGWNRLKCVSCGIGLLTDTTDTKGLGLSADQCYIEPGWGSYLDASNKLVTKKCNKGKYGVPEKQYGITPRPCQPCSENTVMEDMYAPPTANPPDTYDSPTACKAKPGYGWVDNVASACLKGFYKSIYDNTVCSPCGSGLTTPEVTPGSPGATSADQCTPEPGHEWKQPGDDHAEACEIGSYSPGGGAPCTPCPLGSSTELDKSTTIDQCRVCSPGWGMVDPRCQQCTSGSFSPGGSDDPCIACAIGQVSAPGASDSSDCYDAFVQPASYDVITTPASAWQASATAATDEASCQTACTDAPDCQYYMWRDAQDVTSTNGCFFKKTASTPSASTYIAFRLWPGDYVVWQASTDEYDGARTPMQLVDPIQDPRPCFVVMTSVTSTMITL